MSMFRASPRDVLAWLEQNRARHVVLRYGTRVLDTRVKDVDLLIDDQAITGSSRRSGAGVGHQDRLLRCRGVARGDYHGFHHLCGAAGRQILARRRQVAGVGCRTRRMRTVCSTIMAYHSVWQSGFTSAIRHRRHSREPAPRSPPTNAVSPSLHSGGFHRHLESCAAVSEIRLGAYIEPTSVTDESPLPCSAAGPTSGRTEPLVIRRVAVRHGKSEALIERLRSATGLSPSTIDWRTRLTPARRMRGASGAVVECLTLRWSCSIRNQPHHVRGRKNILTLFNRNQFVKVEWRDLVQPRDHGPRQGKPDSFDRQRGGGRPLPLFFSAEERDEIRRSLVSLRAGVSQ